MSLDITANQRNSLASATFLEEANRLIGHNSLFKQGIILVKVWCYQESAKYNGQNLSICGSKEGMFSSYALSILVLYLFNIFPVEMSTPLQVLRYFLEFFSTFQFDKYVLSLDGPVPIQNGGGTLESQGEEKAVENRFRSIAEKVYNMLRSKGKSASTAAYMTDCSKFRLRTCNIVDPVDPINNLGVSVTWKNFKYIKSTLTKGLQHLNDSLMYMESSLIKKNISVSPPVSSDPTTMMSSSSNPSPLMSQTPPPPALRKPIVNMGALSGAVNGIAPGLNFPSNLNAASGLPTTSPTLNTTVPGSLPCVATIELDMSPTNSNAANNISPPPSVQSGCGNPSTLQIAPSISASPAITGIAAPGSVLRTTSGGTSNGCNASAPLLPTNTEALAKEYRFLKRFFPNCVTCYQVENSSGAMHTGHYDSPSNGIMNNTSKLARSTSPFRDITSTLNSSVGRPDRSNSLSFSTQAQHQQLQHLKGGQPSRCTSDTAGASNQQAVSFLGGATIPVRMRSQSYTSLQPSIVDGGRFLPAEESIERASPLQGDLRAMWEALNYDVKTSKKDEFSQSKISATSRVAIGTSDSLSDNSDALTSVDDSSPPRSPSEKENTAHFSTFDINLDISSSAEESKETQVNDRRKESPKVALVNTHVTHPSMPPLIKKMPPLTVPVTVPVTNPKNSFSILESPINRKIVSENNIQAMGSRARNDVNISQNVSQNNNGNSKSKRKKGKSKDTIVECSGGGKGQKNQNRNSNLAAQPSGNNNQEVVDRNPIANVAHDNDNNNNFFLKLGISQYVLLAVLIAVVGVGTYCVCGWMAPATKQSSEMRSAYMKAHQHHAYQRSPGSANIGSMSSGVMGSGFGKKVHSSPATTNPLEERVDHGDENDDDDDEKNKSTPRK